jgi:hypothetical protein
MAGGKIRKFFSSPKKKRYFLFLVTGPLGIIFTSAGLPQELKRESPSTRSKLLVMSAPPDFPLDPAWIFAL